MRALRERVAGLDPTRVDAIFALAMIVELELEAWLSSSVPGSHRLATAVASVFFAAPIAVRRRMPSVALVFCVSVAAIQTLLGGEVLHYLGGAVVPVLALGYSAGAWLNARRSVIALLLALPPLVGVALLPGVGGPPSGLNAISYALFYVSLLIFPGWIAGRVTGERSRRAAAFGELAARTAREQESREAAAIIAERSRIGGELQDIIAHSVSVMVVQASGARMVLRSDPDRARESILNVEHTGREALADLRRLLGMLRKNDDPRALAPQPGLGQLPALIESIAGEGLACELFTLGDPIDLTPGVDLVAYRVIETVLLQAVHHHCSNGVVTVGYEPSELALEISGDGPIGDLDEELAAIAERVGLYDGSLRTARGDGDAFSLQARLPLRATVPA
jgi:signal transduction histidine kinase